MSIFIDFLAAALNNPKGFDEYRIRIINEELEMSAKYESENPDGYLKTRNAVYREREMKQQERTAEEQAQLRDLPEQSKANYGKKESY